MKNILITGGAGFIGSNLALKLIDKGYNIRLLDNLSPQIHGYNPKFTSPLYQSIMGKVDFIQGDVTVMKDWLEAINGQDVLIHLAAETGTGQSMYEIKRDVDVNIGGTAVMLDILTNAKHSVQKIIVASSRAIYGEGKYECNVHGIVYPDSRNEHDMQKGDFECKCPICNREVSHLPTDENSKINPTSIYGITKQNQEQMVLTIGKTLGIPSIAFRYQNVYGPGQSLSNPYTGILSIFSTIINNNHTINIFEDGKESRDFVFVDDAVNATILGIENKTDKYGAYNVGLGSETSVKNVVDTLQKYLHKKIEYKITGNFRLGDIRSNFADISKISNELGYKPTVSFEDGIKRFLDWVAIQNVEVDNYSDSIKEMKMRGLYK